MRFAAVVAAAIAGAALVTLGAQSGKPELSVVLTSPLGRTGISGPVRIVARVTQEKEATLSPVQFFVDGKLLGEDKDGPPYAIEWVDDNPFEKRELVVQVADSRGNTAKDTVELKPIEVVDSTSVASVLLEATVTDNRGRPINNLKAEDFEVFEDDEPQKLDLASPDTIPATYTLLVDSSQSMSRRMDFVRDAAKALPERLRPQDQVIVVPFTTKLGSVTGPTQDRETIASAITSIHSTGGTAILNSLAAVAQQIRSVPGRHIIVLITDGYDENSNLAYEKSLDDIKGTQATVYVVGVAGTAGISMKGEDLLKRLAKETGGQAFFPSREFQLSDINGLIASDVQQRYVLTYTPSNQVQDGSWRTITLKTSNPDYGIKVRPGYFSPAPPPVKPQLDLIIRDTNKQFIDVSADDLVVVEDGVEQSIEVFSESLTPVSLMMVLDSSGSMKKDATQVIEAAKSFVDALPKKDKLALMTFADKVDLAHDLTTLREWTMQAIVKYQTVGGTALWDALVESITHLKKAEGQRAVVVLTDGRDENNAGNAAGSTHTFDDVLKAIKGNADTRIYTIGLGPNVDRPKLEKVAEDSGGESYFPAEVGALAAEYRRILENLRRRYTISYTSTNFRRDGAWRKVEIKSKRDGIVIESKGGYFGPKEK